jgi:hypothetical protein
LVGWLVGFVVLCARFCCLVSFCLKVFFVCVCVCGVCGVCGVGGWGVGVWGVGLVLRGEWVGVLWWGAVVMLGKKVGWDSEQAVMSSDNVEWELANVEW